MLVDDRRAAYTLAMDTQESIDIVHIVPERLTASEIEQLRRDRKETHDFCQKLFGQAKMGQAGMVHTDSGDSPQPP